MRTFLNLPQALNDGGDEEVEVDGMFVGPFCQRGFSKPYHSMTNDDLIHRKLGRFQKRIRYNEGRLKKDLRRKFNTRERLNNTVSRYSWSVLTSTFSIFLF